MGTGGSKGPQKEEAMTAIVLPDIDRSTLEDLKRRMPSLRLSDIEIPSIRLSDIEVPSMEKAGRDADRVIDRVMGRSRPTVWPWIAAGIGIAAVVGVAAALMTWMRRPAWSGGDRYGGSASAGTFGSTTESNAYERTTETGGTYDTGTGAYDPTTSATTATSDYGSGLASDGGQP